MQNLENAARMFQASTFTYSNISVPRRINSLADVPGYVDKLLEIDTDTIVLQIANLYVLKRYRKEILIDVTQRLLAKRPTTIHWVILETLDMDSDAAVVKVNSIMANIRKDYPTVRLTTGFSSTL